MLRVDPGNDSALIQVLEKYGPVAVAIDGHSQEFKSYKSGVFSGECSKDKIGKNNNKINYIFLIIKLIHQKIRSFF